MKYRGRASTRLCEGGGQFRAVIEEEKGEWEVCNTSPPAMLFFLAYIHRFSLESITFYLLHLSLMREYLNLEFQDIEPALPFNYNLERVIDDFIPARHLRRERFPAQFS